MRSTIGSWTRLLPLTLLVIVFAACEMVAGIDDLSVYRPPESDAGTEDVQEQETGPAQCTLGDGGVPSSSALRFANLVPSTDAVDFCVKPSSEAVFGSPPVLRGHGVQCPALAYGQVLIPVAMDAGEYDIKVVSSEDADCSGVALSEVTGVEVAEARTVTVLRLGGAGGVEEKLVAHAEVRFSKDQSTRLVHAVSTDEKVFFGVAASEALPTSIAAPFTEGVGMGAVPAANPDVVGLGAINEAGYLGSMIQFNFGATKTGSKDALFVATPSEGQAFTIFAVGLPGSFEYPVRGLLCKEDRFTGAGMHGVERDYLTSCEFTKLKQVTVDTINAGLYGDFAPFEAQRRDPLIQAIANLPSDFVCVQEMTREADRAHLVASASGSFPHAYNPQFDLDTSFTDARDQTGTVPPAAGPSCAAVSDKLLAAIACVTEKCAADPGNPDVPMGDVGADCFSKRCAAQFLPLLVGAEEARCLSCLVVNLLSSETMTDTQELCLNDERPQLAFRGASTEVMLSKYPLSEMESYVFPSTSYRRAVLYAKAEVGPEEFLDVYCLQLTYVQGSTFPYSGQHGQEMVVDGIATPLKGWASEQYLQAQRAVDWIKGRGSEGALAVIAGDLSSGDADTADLTELNPASVRLFRASFSEALVPGYVPSCNFCAYPENPYGSEDGFWLAHIFTSGREVGVLSTERTLMEKSVALPVSPFEGTLSDNFGIRSKVIYGLTW